MKTLGQFEILLALIFFAAALGALSIIYPGNTHTSDALGSQIALVEDSLIIERTEGPSINCMTQMGEKMDDTFPFKIRDMKPGHVCWVREVDIFFFGGTMHIFSDSYVYPTSREVIGRTVKISKCGTRLVFHGNYGFGDSQWSPVAFQEDREDMSEEMFLSC